MAFALAKENEAFINRMICQGRFNNQSEVVREALRRMEREETSYLNPPALTPDQIKRIYGPDPEAEAREQALGKAALRAVRKTRARQ
ncbi:MAG: type II toxin-antitoxin system ParD family antitoxin [Verrucomicrobia bacterium]|nr:type II toxin-antitoxin system ParD family antitoxin [Verrucomicrobiota bacterium]